MAFSVRTIQAFCYRYPLSTPVVTSFGRMLNRPAVFVRVEDEDGVVGWGEVWSNFPSTGAEHRARLDVNDNPLRDQFCGPVFDVSEGLVALNEEPGLGITPDVSSIERYRTL